MQPVTFEYTASPGQTCVGFIAEHLDAIGCREAVVYNADGLPESIRMYAIPALTVAALQQLRQDFLDLKEAFDALKASLQ